jgi:lipoate-protein ligase A
MVKNKKISGSSQRRGARAILHHGTLLYNADQKIMLRYIRGDQIIRSGKGTSSSYREVTSVSDQVDVTMDDVYRAVIESLLEGKETYSHEWSAEELDKARDLIGSRYGNEDWNKKL